jgi:hypothetical protein
MINPIEKFEGHPESSLSGRARPRMRLRIQQNFAAKDKTPETGEGEAKRGRHLLCSLPARQSC